MNPFFLSGILYLMATNTYAIPVSYCADIAIKSAEETSDFITEGYIHHKGCTLVKIFASPSPSAAKEGTAVIQCKDEKSLVVWVSLKVVKTADEENESCSVETKFLRK